MNWRTRCTKYSPTCPLVFTSWMTYRTVLTTVRDENTSCPVGTECTIRSPLLLRACKTLVHALVTSTLDFGNVALFLIAATLLYRLEMVQRAAARVVLCIDRRDHRSMTAALRELHWLPIAQRIEFKVLTLMKKKKKKKKYVYLT